MKRENAKKRERNVYENIKEKETKKKEGLFQPRHSGTSQVFYG